MSSHPHPTAPASTVPEAHPLRGCGVGLGERLEKVSTGPGPGVLRSFRRGGDTTGSAVLGGRAGGRHVGEGQPGPTGGQVGCGAGGAGHARQLGVQREGREGDRRSMTRLMEAQGATVGEERAEPGAGDEPDWTSSLEAAKVAGTAPVGSCTRSPALAVRGLEGAGRGAPGYGRASEEQEGAQDPAPRDPHVGGLSLQRIPCPARPRPVGVRSGHAQKPLPASLTGPGVIEHLLAARCPRPVLMEKALEKRQLAARDPEGP